MAKIYLAGGCFWGMEKYIAAIRGVTATEVGYANGDTENPTYEDVCRNNTGHAETVKVEYQPEVVSLPFLLHLYFSAIDPTSVNRQGGDHGTQYRTGIFYTDGSDLPVIRQEIAKLQEKYAQPIAIEVLALDHFYPAEEYHQKYLDKNPTGYCHISRDKFRKAAEAIVDPTLYQKPDAAALTKALTPLQFHVTQENATEPPYQNAFNAQFEPGLYVDITTGEPLFTSDDKFESACGWPSFTKPADPNTIIEKSDLTHGMIRTEVRSRVGDAHLGHVFEDGPEQSGGLRYCINSAALRFIPYHQLEEKGYGEWAKRIIHD